MKSKGALMLARGFRIACPSCGQHTLFCEGNYFRVERTCPNCGLPIDRGGGFFLGPVALNYGFVAFGIISPIVLLGATGVISVNVALVAGIAATLIFPILFYRLAWSLWVAGFYFFQPHLVAADVRAVWDDTEF